MKPRVNRLQESHYTRPEIHCNAIIHTALSHCLLTFNDCFPFILWVCIWIELGTKDRTLNIKWILTNTLYCKTSSTIKNRWILLFKQVLQHDIITLLINWPIMPIYFHLYRLISVHKVQYCQQIKTRFNSEFNSVSKSLPHYNIYSAIIFNNLSDTTVQRFLF